MSFAKKHLGQHFLIDKNIINKIIDYFNDKTKKSPKDSIIIEIGPGLGALTHHLVNYFNHIFCIEIDKRAVNILSDTYSSEQLTIINQDVLKVDFNNLFDNYNYNIIGNLPYNISTPLLFHLLKNLSKINFMFFMLQEEVIDRIIAKPNCKKYGRLSVMLQSICKLNKVMSIAPQCFDPPPKVNSAMIAITPDDKYNIYKNYNLLEKIVALSFNHRRKTIYNNLKNLLSQQELINLNIDPKARAENLTVLDYVNLTKYIAKLNPPVLQ